MKDLKDTAKYMSSLLYQDRFKAEVWQVKIRLERLHDTIEKYKAGTLDFKPDCSVEILEEQAKIMDDYLTILKVRAELEGIVLDV